MTNPNNASRLCRRSFLMASAAALTAVNREAHPEETESVDKVPPLDQRMQALEEGAPLAMQFRGRTADEARRWQKEFAAKLRALLGPHRPPEKWECHLERRVEAESHIREERVLTATGVAPVPFHLLLPRAKTGASKRAGILALHGHGPYAHDAVAGIDNTSARRANIADLHYDYGRKLVEHGYVVAAPCLTPFGRRSGKTKPKGFDLCTLTNLRLQYLGKLLIAENLRDILWTLEFLARHDAVDPHRLGCVGLSLGGRMTMLTAAVEPRIRIAVISGALNCFQERALNGSVAGCQVIPGLLEYGDVPEIASLIAPRPCLWEVGSRDKLLPAAWADKALARQRRVYAALNAAEQIHVDRFDGVHQWHGEMAYPLLRKTLQS